MKRISFLLLCIIVINSYIYGDLLACYKKGTIKIEPVPGFGKGVDWESLFYDTNKDIVIAYNGTIFVSNSLQHTISMFTPDGKFIKKISQKGLGPGDTYYPGELSILDNKYLVVSEDPVSRRVSLFTLDGKYYKLLRINATVFNAIALRDNKIAYKYYKYNAINNQQKTVEIIVIIKDINSGKENPVFSTILPDKSNLPLDDSGLNSIKLDNMIGNVIISSMKNGNLIVGVTNTLEIKMFTPDGKPTQSITLSMPHLKATSDYINKYKNNILNTMENGSNSERPVSKKIFNKVKSTSFSNLFGDYLPYYNKLLVDEEGNILLFKWTDCIGECPIIFQVYSPTGKYICETQIDKGQYDFFIDMDANNIAFMKSGIFGLFQLKNSEDISLRIIKVKVD